MSRGGWRGARARGGRSSTPKQRPRKVFAFVTKARLSGRRSGAFDTEPRRRPPVRGRPATWGQRAIADYEIFHAGDAQRRRQQKRPVPSPQGVSQNAKPRASRKTRSRFDPDRREPPAAPELAERPMEPRPDGREDRRSARGVGARRRRRGRGAGHARPEGTEHGGGDETSTSSLGTKAFTL